MTAFSLAFPGGLDALPVVEDRALLSLIIGFPRIVGIHFDRRYEIPPVPRLASSDFHMLVDFRTIVDFHMLAPGVWSGCAGLPVLLCFAEGTLFHPCAQCMSPLLPLFFASRVLPLSRVKFLWSQTLR